MLEVYTMQQTNLNPVSTVDSTKEFPTISQPKTIGFFSVGPDREYIPSAENLKYLRLPKSVPDKPLRIDLNEGFQIRKPKPDSAKHERIDHLLRFIVENELHLRERISEADHNKRLNCDFVCFRGLLRMVMCTPYEWKTGWIILASRYKKTIYLCAQDTPEKIAEEANQTEQQKRFCYYGFKFEQHILADDPNSLPDTESPVLESEEFCVLFRTTLERKRIMYGAEMDGIISNESVKNNLCVDHLQRLEFVEVKVKRTETNQRQVDNFYRFKTRNWWCQSFLVNIQRLFVGLRNDGGFVDEIKEMSLKELDRSSRQFWSASVCTAFLSQFLDTVQLKMQGINCPHTVYRFEYDARSGNILFGVQEGRNNDSFLPNWYCSTILK
ncbi:decapping nuclease DXO homolog [Topomyia yanbarensis]|uniref:decapping nuclease DXO homolog n=1 Tax=Topomyia yanbarensis TaxID=2498891 RepID=UPI00273B1DAC|nr:decapping nuclease DXO homolog [Topomyia yanbarensis]XP_058838251.1 decapping nuclease DXO homolog [Topomyia yanbarensis]